MYWLDVGGSWVKGQEQCDQIVPRAREPDNDICYEPAQRHMSAVTVPARRGVQPLGSNSSLYAMFKLH